MFSKLWSCGSSNEHICKILSDVHCCFGCGDRISWSLGGLLKCLVFLPPPPNYGVTGVYHYAQPHILFVCLFVCLLQGPVGLKRTDSHLPPFPETKLGTSKGPRLKRRCLDSDRTFRVNSLALAGVTLHSTVLGDGPAEQLWH